MNNNLVIEKYIKLKHKQMYIEWKDIQNFRNIGVSDFPNLSDDIFNMVEPLPLFSAYNDNFIDMNIQDVFEFSDEVLKNSHNLLDTNMTNYMSIHLRLGDKYLETDKEFIRCKADERKYNENNLFNCIETNKDKNIIFFCDNNSYKLKIKNIYNNVIICKSDIGHTDLFNTTDKQILDTLTELYLLTNSEKIYYASVSGFSFVAAKFKNILIIFKLFNPIIEKTCNHINFNLEQISRCIAGIQGVQVMRKQNKICNIHINQETPHLVLLYYVNDADGETLLYDKTADDIEDDEMYLDEKHEFNVVNKIMPKQGRILLFDGKTYHS